MNHHERMTEAGRFGAHDVDGHASTMKKALRQCAEGPFSIEPRGLYTSPEYERKLHATRNFSLRTETQLKLLLLLGSALLGRRFLLGLGRFLLGCHRHLLKNVSCV